MISNKVNQYLNNKFSPKELDIEFDNFQKFNSIFWNYSYFDPKTNNYTAAHFNKIQTTNYTVLLCKEETFRKNIKILSNELKDLFSSYCELPNPVFQTARNKLKLSEYFVLGKMKYLFDILSPYQQPNTNVHHITKLKVPCTFYPIYISLLANVTKYSQKWKQLKEYIYDNIKYFTLKQTHKPYLKFYDITNDEYTSLCENWLNWFLPDDLYTLANFLDTHNNKLNDINYNLTLLFNDICNTNYFKTISVQNEFFKVLKKEFKPNTSPSLYISELYGDTNNTINFKSEYNIFLSLSESFYLWEDNLYQSYLK